MFQIVAISDLTVSQGSVVAFNVWWDI